MGRVNRRSTANALFLHGGPGMTSELERRQFGETLSVYWWDQPRVDAGNPRAFGALVDAAVVEIARLSADRNGPVDLLANSFGAYLARALVERVPEKIGAITICGGIWDLRTAIMRLGCRFADRNDDVDLRKACQRASETDTPEGYIEFLARVAARPDFLDSYWSPAAVEPRKKMKLLAAEGRLIDWTTFQSVMSAALAAPPQVPLSSPHPGGVRILLGRFDLYFDESDIAAWKTLWPSASVEIVEAGHFPHLELPPAIWMPS